MKLYAPIEVQGEFPAVNTKDVRMPVQAGTATLNPGVYYQFGEVSELAVELAPGLEGSANEYVFEFDPADDFAGLTITPEVRWMAEPQYPVGKKCVVSVCMGLAVMGCG